jgi:hypothetical protein
MVYVELAHGAGLQPLFLFRFAVSWGVAPGWYGDAPSALFCFSHEYYYCSHFAKAKGIIRNPEAACLVGSSVCLNAMGSY